MTPKQASVLRRIPALHIRGQLPSKASEGDVCLFELTQDAPITLEAASGRPLIVVPGDRFFGTTGYRESTRWVVGGTPDGGLVPGETYSVLADCGMVGDLVGASALEKPYVGQVTYIGLALDEAGQPLNIRQFRLEGDRDAADCGAAIHLLLGTSAEVGKTTAGTTLVRTLRRQGNERIVVLKATGTASVGELMMYRDFGAVDAFDCVDFGLPATFPANRPDIDTVFEDMLASCLAIAADAVLIECGSDMLGANVPDFLKCLTRRRPSGTKVILAAADALAASGGVRVLADMGIAVDLITGPCTDTPVIQQRTQALCGVPVMKMGGPGGATTRVERT